MALLACLLLGATKIVPNTTSTQPSSTSAIEEEYSDVMNEHESYNNDEQEEYEATPRTINAIIVTGNSYVPTDAILNRLPFKPGEIFDPNLTRRLINNLYYELKRFRTISIFGEDLDDDRINLHITVEEKKLLKDAVFEGNSQVTTKEIREKINFADIPAVDEEELKRYALSIKKIYRDKGYHTTDIATELRLDEDGKATAIFKITEHKKATVKRINFKGNHHVSGKELRSLIFTREDWILSFMDKAGTYQPERLEGDKHVIEQFYQNRGYINAKVVDIEVITDPITQFITLIYEIQEGDCYTISSVKASGNDILSDDLLTAALPIRVGDLYSRDKIVDSIRTLEFIWGDLGYSYAHVEPSVQPDDEQKTVSISFYTEQGKPVILNKLTIRGNKKTRDKVIRRKILLEEGGLITTRQMDASKNRVESLGYFDQRDGVNWKMTRLADDLADLDLFVKEIKTGNAHIQLGFGGSAALSSPSDSVSVEGNITDTNLFGSGIRMNLSAKLAADEKNVIFNLTEPWLFDKPIFGSLDLYHKRVAYDQLRLTRPVNEKDTGGAIATGFVTGSRHALLNDTFMRFTLGLDDIRYEDLTGNVNNESRPIARIPELDTPLLTAQARDAYNIILAKEFTPGTFATFTAQIGKDAKNHPMFPTRGYSWIGRAVASCAVFDDCLGFYKSDLDAHWYTPLIGEFDLILHLHGYCGFVTAFKNKSIPYRELFHIGGPASVRGFLFGQIGPQFCVTKDDVQICDSIGGKNTFFVNVELLFPITPDFSIRGVVFYDGGTGWNNPFACCVPSQFITNNSFDYRHAVGVGLRLRNPMPIKIDWGFKLDPRNLEPASEVHFGMSYDW